MESAFSRQVGLLPDCRHPTKSEDFRSEGPFNVNNFSLSLAEMAEMTAKIGLATRLRVSQPRRIFF